MVLLASVLASHSLVDRLEWNTRGRNLAEAVVQEAWLKLRHDRSWGLAGDEVIQITLPGDEQAQGVLQFQGADSSHNNLEGDFAIPGWLGLTVPPHCAQLIGVGRCRGVEVRVQVMLKSAGFPYAVACQGPFVSTGGTRISASLDPTENSPADMACNAADETAVQLGPESWVAGDLRSAGGIVLAPQSKVVGQTLPYSDAVALPTIELSQFDPASHAIPFQNLPVQLSSQTVVGECRCSSDLNVAGDLTLDGATVYVQGNLIVTGSLRGNGLVVVRGNVDVRGSTVLDTAHHAVLLSGGNVNLRGNGADASSFSGLVYSEGSFCAEQVSMIGVFIAHGSQPTILDSCRVVYDPKAGTLQANHQLLLSWSKVSADTVSDPLLNGAASNWGVSLGQVLRLLPQISGASLDRQGDQRTLTLTLGEGKSATDTSKKLFELNDFLGQGRPLELLSWRENE